MKQEARRDSLKLGSRKASVATLKLGNRRFPFKLGSRRLPFPALVLNHLQEVLAVLILSHRLGNFAHLVGRNPALFIGDAFEAAHLEARALLDNFDEG